MKKLLVILLISSLIIVMGSGCEEVKEQAENIIEVAEEIKEEIEEEVDEDLDENLMQNLNGDKEDGDSEADDSVEELDEDDKDTGGSGDDDGASDTSMVIDLETDSNQVIMEKLGSWLKYEVSDLDYEAYENEVYDLSYFTEAGYEEVVNYFFAILAGSEDYVGDQYPAELGKGYGFKGTLEGLTTVVEITYDDDDEGYVVIFCRPKEW